MDGKGAISEVVTLATDATSATADASMTAGTSEIILQFTWNGSAGGSLAIQGTIDGTNWGSLGSATAGAGTTTLVHLIDKRVKSLRVQFGGLTGVGAAVTVKAAKVTR